MEFTNEMIKKAQKAASAEELIQIAKADGVSLSAEDAERYFAFLHESKELSENELEAVSGGELDGKGGEKQKDPPAPKYSKGQSLWIGFPTSRTIVGITVLWLEFYNEELKGWRYYVELENGTHGNYYLESHKYVFTYNPGTWPE